MSEENEMWFRLTFCRGAGTFIKAAQDGWGSVSQVKKLASYLEREYCGTGGVWAGYEVLYRALSNEEIAEANLDDPKKSDGCNLADILADLPRKLRLVGSRDDTLNRIADLEQNWIFAKGNYIRRIADLEQELSEAQREIETLRAA